MTKITGKSNADHKHFFFFLSIAITTSEQRSSIKNIAKKEYLFGTFD